MFIPGIGAVIRLRQHTSNPHEDARIGLAGPMWGLGAAVVAAGVFYASGAPIWAAIARVGAWINLFNLMPIWQLDGGRAFRAFSRPQRWLAATAIAVAWSWTDDGLLLLLLLVAGFQAAFGRPSARPDARSLVLYVGLVVILSAMLLIPVSLRLSPLPSLDPLLLAA
jgi:Zn-dependent protease